MTNFCSLIELSAIYSELFQTIHCIESIFLDLTRLMLLVNPGLFLDRFILQAILN